MCPQTPFKLSFNLTEKQNKNKHVGISYEHVTILFIVYMSQFFTVSLQL